MLMISYSSQNNYDLIDADLYDDEEGFERIADTLAGLYQSPGGKKMVGAQ